MSIEEIKNSGILESYVLGDLSNAEQEQVRSYLLKFPELQNEVKEIERAFHAYAQSQSIPPRSELGKEILEKITKSDANPSPKTENKKNPPRKNNFILPTVILASLFALSWILAYNMFQRKKEIQQEYEDFKVICDSLEERSNASFAIMEQLKAEGNNIVALEATAKYPQTALYFHNNKVTKKNFIQVLNLPDISADQAFQLWSLKDGIDPIPLNVFVSDGGNFAFEVDHIDETNAYAITIEPAGGSTTPTLENLIGVISV